MIRFFLVSMALLLPLFGATLAIAEPRITAGTKVPDWKHQAKWSFLVAVHRGSGSQLGSQTCGGSLIDERHVVTAAHCVVDAKGVFATPGSLKVSADTNLLDATKYGWHGLRLSVVDIFVHPNYRLTRRFARGDVAVLRLGEPASGIQPIELARSDDESHWRSRKAWIAGWGLTVPRDPASFPAIVHEADLNIRPSEVCQSPSSRGGFGSGFLPSEVLCAGNVEGRYLEKSACHGDSGGPLISDTPNGPRLIGVVSHGWEDECGEWHYGVYSRVDAASEWIENVTSRWSPGATDLEVIGSGYKDVTIAWQPTPGHEGGDYDILVRTTHPDLGGVDVKVMRTKETDAVVPVRAMRQGSTVVSVAPVFADGSRGPRTSVSASPTYDETPPSVRHGISLRRSGARTVRVIWGLSRDDESGIAGYVVEYRVAGRGAWKQKYTDGPHITAIGPLAKRATYEFRVWAVDWAGNGLVSATKRITL